METGFLNNQSASKGAKHDGKLSGGSGDVDNKSSSCLAGQTSLKSSQSTMNSSSYHSINPTYMSTPINEPIITDWTDDDGDINMSTRVDKNVVVQPMKNINVGSGVSRHVDVSDGTCKGVDQLLRWRNKVTIILV